MSAGADILGVTEETFSAIKSVTQGFFTSSGLAGVDLQPLVSLVPVDTPFRNSNPRVGASQGAQFAYWETLLNVNNLQSNAAIQEDYAGPLISTEVQYVYAPFSVLSQAGRVTQDAIDQANGYADALAVMTLQVLNQVMISDDINQINALAYPLQSCPTPSVSASSTNGTIASGTAVYVICAQRSGNNFYYGGSGPGSSAGTVTVGTTTSTNSVTATVAARRNVAAYDWFVGTSPSNCQYYTTTTVNSVTITGGPYTAPQALPSLPLLSSVAPTTPPTADTSYQSYWMNGLIATINGDFSNTAGGGFVTPGTGTSQGSVFTSLDGASFALSGAAIEQLDTLNEEIYNNYQVSPTRYLVSSQGINDLANAVLSTNAAMTWLVPTDSDGRAQITMGGRVAKYLNKTTGGSPITLELQPHLPPGELVAVVDSVPFPGANIDTVLSVETQRDYARFDYGANYNPGVVGGGPRNDFEVRSRQAFRNKASAVMGVLANIGAGVST